MQQQLADVHALAEKNAKERDEADQRARQAETKALSLNRELEELQDKQEESERQRRALQAERDALVESKDDVGKNVSQVTNAPLFQSFPLGS